MGNKLCKKKSETVDNSNCKSPSQFDRIMNRLHFPPNSWKSDPQLHQKQAKRIERLHNARPNNVIISKPFSKSSDWTEVDLEVPEKDEPIHLTNPKLNLIFNNEKGTPTPPPRKYKKNFRKKIEAVAKNSLQAFQSKKPVEDSQPKKPVQEELFVKKTINYKCPICDQDEVNHNRDHHHNHLLPDQKKVNKSNSQDKENFKKKKTLSVSSLPNYDELKLTVAEFDEAGKDVSSLNPARKSSPSEISLPTDAKKSIGSAGKLDTYITRCRSFGSIFPQQLKKLRPRKVPADIESDDSFGGLEDWDLGLIEHYNPKDASLPRPRKAQRSNDSVLADIESLIVKEEDMEKPIPPVRRSESLVKKMNREAAQTAHERSNELYKIDATPPPSPEPKLLQCEMFVNLPIEENGQVEHSSLMKILEKFSIQDIQKQKNESNPMRNISSNESSLTPSLVEFEKSINSVEDSSNDEKNNREKEKVDKNTNKYQLCQDLNIHSQ